MKGQNIHLSNRALIAGAGILLVFALALTACGGGTGASTKIDVKTLDFAFEPKTWTVPAGQTVTVTITNQGLVEHEWVLVKLGEKVTLPFDADDEAKVIWEIEAEPGQTKTGTFTAPAAPGVYDVVCGTPQHLEVGMEGTLTVVP